MIIDDLDAEVDLEVYEGPPVSITRTDPITEMILPRKAEQNLAKGHKEISFRTPLYGRALAVGDDVVLHSDSEQTILAKVVSIEVASNKEHQITVRIP